AAAPASAVTVKSAATSTGRARLSGASPTATGLRYVVESTDSLTEPDWVEVGRKGATSASGSATVTGETPETGARFFRVRLLK
ncbi:MAG: hypothetical protein IJP66_03135, partial [Kiritimatiellae bacterium]|nr:hypothetical protein [Kiritimatiellia bacterium]